MLNTIQVSDQQLQDLIDALDATEQSEGRAELLASLKWVAKNNQGDEIHYCAE